MGWIFVPQGKLSAASTWYWQPFMPSLTETLPFPEDAVRSVILGNATRNWSEEFGRNIERSSATRGRWLIFYAEVLGGVKIRTLTTVTVHWWYRRVIHSFEFGCNRMRTYVHTFMPGRSVSLSRVPVGAAWGTYVKKYTINGMVSMMENEGLIK